MSCAVQDLFAVDRRTPSTLRWMIAAYDGKGGDSQKG
jgi:hypothetical protein